MGMTEEFATVEHEGVQVGVHGNDIDATEPACPNIVRFVPYHKSGARATHKALGSATAGHRIDSRPVESLHRSQPWLVMVMA